MPGLRHGGHTVPLRSNQETGIYPLPGMLPEKEGQTESQGRHTDEAEAKAPAKAAKAHDRRATGRQTGGGPLLILPGAH